MENEKQDKDVGTVNTVTAKELYDMHELSSILERHNPTAQERILSWLNSRYSNTLGRLCIEAAERMDGRK